MVSGMSTKTQGIFKTIVPNSVRSTFMPNDDSYCGAVCHAKKCCYDSSMFSILFSPLLDFYYRQCFKIFLFPYRKSGEELKTN